MKDKLERMFVSLLAFRRDDRGQSLIEYALLPAFAALSAGALVATGRLDDAWHMVIDAFP
jgi:Flp pilus assembly pilin Flp